MQGTLRGYAARPLTTPRDMSKVPVALLAKAIHSRIKGVTPAIPEQDAMAFYFGNHVVSTIRQKYLLDQPLGEAEELVKWYYDRSNEIAVRMFYYCLLICVRESRHLLDKGNLESEITAKYGYKNWQYLKTVPDDAHQAAAVMYKNPPDASLGSFCDTLVYAFYNGGWHGGYGGPKWGYIAKVVRDFVYGDLTAEMMVDTAFTLAHNGGPIFNKGMFFHHYDGSALKALLDVQRSGQIPECVMEQTIKGPVNYSEFQPYLKMYKEKVGAELRGYVDWYLVDQLGGIGSHSGYKAQQVQKYGESPHMQEAQKAAIAAALKAKDEADKLAAMQAAEKAEFLKTHVEIMPNCYVEIVGREAPG